MASYDSMVLDVMSNGGGIVCLGYRLAQMLVETFWEEPTKSLYEYDLRHSPLMAAYVQATGALTPDPDATGDDFILEPKSLRRFNSTSWYTEPLQYVRGGVLGNYSHRFKMNCSSCFQYRPEAKPRRWLPPSKLLILTDGLCGSTCATFMMVINEHQVATTVGVGGISEFTMAVSSFAGGAVSNMDVMGRIGKLANRSIPQFSTSAGWQFTWYELYSQVYTNSPVQFVMQPPTVRIPWWDFPHPTVPADQTEQDLARLYDLALGELLRLNPGSDAGSRGADVY